MHQSARSPHVDVILFSWGGVVIFRLSCMTSGGSEVVALRSRPLDLRRFVFLAHSLRTGLHSATANGDHSDSHCCRIRARNFLMPTCLVEFVVGQNLKGVTVDLPQAVEVYLRLCSHRPMSAVTATHLRRLVRHRNSRRRFGVSLHRNFMLTLTTLPTS